MSDTPSRPDPAAAFDAARQETAAHSAASQARQMVLLRRALVGGACLWAVFYLRQADRFGLLDNVDLPIHETGHLVFSPFGEFVQFAGGTIFQLLFPLVFVGYFLRRGDRFAGWFLMGWVAQNLWNVSRYVADARAQELPLVGGGEHDWAYLLGRMGLLAHDQGIASGIHLAGLVLFAFAMLFAFLSSDAPPAAAQSTPG
jgi:hypothetical protein